MYRSDFWRFFAKIWPEKTTSRDGCVLLTKERQSSWQETEQAKTENMKSEVDTFLGRDMGGCKTYGGGKTYQRTRSPENFWTPPKELLVCSVVDFCTVLNRALTPEGGRKRTVRGGVHDTPFFGHGEVRVYRGTGVSRGVRRTAWERSLENWELQMPCFEEFFWGGNTLGLVPASLPHTLGYACTFYAPTSPPPIFGRGVIRERFSTWPPSFFHPPMPSSDFRRSWALPWTPSRDVSWDLSQGVLE